MLKKKNSIHTALRRQFICLFQAYKNGLTLAIQLQMITIQTTRIHEYYHGISFLGFFPFHMFIDRFVCWTEGRTQVLLSIPFIIPIVGFFAQIFNKKDRKKIRFNITFIEYMNFIYSFISFVCTMVVFTQIDTEN